VPDSAVIFAPSPLLRVTIEERAGVPDIHVQAGGQGLWQARTIAGPGVPVVLCVTLGGEAGEVLRHLIPSEGVQTEVVRTGSGDGGYVHDRRGGDRDPIAEAPGGPLDQGPDADPVIPASLYRRRPIDLLDAGWASGDEPDTRVEAMRRLRVDDADTVIVSRADRVQPAEWTPA